MTMNMVHRVYNYMHSNNRIHDSVQAHISLQSVAACSSSAVSTAALAGEQPGAEVHCGQQAIPNAQQKINAPVAGIQPGLCFK